MTHKNKYIDYWRRSLRYLAFLLAIWFTVSYLFGTVPVAAGLLLMISSAIAHDLLKRGLSHNISEKQELIAACIAAKESVPWAC